MLTVTISRLEIEMTCAVSEYREQKSAFPVYSVESHMQKLLRV